MGSLGFFPVGLDDMDSPQNGQSSASSSKTDWPQWGQVGRSISLYFLLQSANGIKKRCGGGVNPLKIPSFKRGFPVRPSPQPFSRRQFHGSEFRELRSFLPTKPRTSLRFCVSSAFLGKLRHPDLRGNPEIQTEICHIAASLPAILRQHCQGEQDKQSSEQMFWVLAGSRVPRTHWLTPSILSLKCLH